MDIQKHRTLFLLGLFTLIFSSCSAIAGIFKTGMGVGIFLVVMFVVIIGVIATRARK